jgi:hypothetical protein
VPLKVRWKRLKRWGDPRLRQNNWVRIPVGVFVMGEGDGAPEVNWLTRDRQIPGDGGGIRPVCGRRRAPWHGKAGTRKNANDVSVAQGRTSNLR